MLKQEDARRVQTGFKVMRLCGGVMKIKSLECLLNCRMTKSSLVEISVLAGNEWTYRPSRKLFVFIGTITTTTLNIETGE